MRSREVRLFRRAVKACADRGEITRQQARTLCGQAVRDLEGAKRGLRRIYA